jgi:hypothetical protein
LGQDVGHLSDLDGRDDLIGELLAVMKEVAGDPPKPSRLGKIDKEHFRTCFDDWYGLRRPDRFWHRRVEVLTDAGIPWVAEVAIASTKEPGHAFFAINYSPSYVDPLSRTRLIHENIWATGAGSFLSNLDAWPGSRGDGTFANRAVLVHLITPTASFLEKGKSTLDVPYRVDDRIARAMFQAGQPLFKEHKARQRNAARAEREARAEEEPRVSLKDACYEVMEEAVDAASGGGRLPFSAHTLYYQVRPRIQDFTDEELTSHYFEQTVVVQFQQDFGPIDGMYREARGMLIEPHTGHTVPLGTREVAGYEFPEYVFGAILFVEKKGLNPVWRSGRLGERLDLGIVNGEGQPQEAVLFARAEGEFLLFVLHDADHHGYVIAHTIAEATKRMPKYKVKVVDIGLTVADAIRLRLPTETYFRSTALPKWMVPQLTPDEREWFEGEFDHYNEKRRPVYRCTRVELNAFTTPDLLAFVEKKLHAAKAKKIVPPEDVIDRHATEDHATAVREWVTAKVAELLNLDQVAEALITDTVDSVVKDTPNWVTAAYKKDNAVYWRDAVTATVSERLRRRDKSMTAKLKRELGLP